MRGRKSLLHFIDMKTEDQIATFALPKIQELGAFLVEIKALPNKVIIELDKKDGITINDCTVLSRFLFNEPQLAAVFEKYELEVSSPGTDKPFKVKEQYARNVGKKVKVKVREGISYSGNMITVTEEGIEVQELPLKKKETGAIHFLPFNDIIETRIIF